MQAIEKTFGLIDSTMTSGLIVNVVLALVIRAPMKQMWNMINTLQILTYMPELNMKLPQNFVICLNTIKEISNLSVVPKSVIDWVISLFKGQMGSSEDKMN
jgi:hypothetical protein